MGRNTRGRLYVDRDVQRALLWQLFRHWSIFVVVLVAMLLVLEGLSGPPRSLGEYAAALWTRHAPLLVVIASLFPVFAYDSIKLSHRFVGPVIRLRGALRSAAAGEPVKPLKFRQGDFWQDMADHFNDLMNQVQQERTRRDRVPTDVWDETAAGATSDQTKQGSLQEV